MHIYISHSSSYDYERELYAPIKNAAFYHRHTFFLPHEPENSNTSAKDELNAADLLVAEVSLPSTGQGIELGLATAAAVPIVCFYKEGSKPSSSLRFVTDKILSYNHTDDMLTKLERLLIH